MIAVNDAIFVTWFADWLHACDKKWWDWHPCAHAFGGLKTSLEPVPNVRTLNNTGTEGFDPDPRNCRTGGNGAFQAMHCAVHASAKRIVLLGVDMRGTHWFGEHPNRVTTEHSLTMIPHFKSLVQPLADRGIDVVNCSPGSALECFRHEQLEQVIGEA